MIAGTMGDSSYCSYKDYGKPFYIWAKDQKWDEDTCKELKAVIDYDDFLVKHEQDDPCKNCPRQGKNCDPQRCL